MATLLPHDHMVSLIASALGAGAIQKSLTTTVWDCAGGCEAPVTVELVGRPTNEYGRYVEISAGTKATLFLDILSRCRRCPPCLRARKRLWTSRASAEITSAARTWFGTLTFKPSEQVKILAKARLSVSSFETLSSLEQFRCMAKASGASLTRYLKRLRKVSRAPLRYLAVAERHKSGNVHWHLLVHETDAALPVRNAQLQGQWSYHGFSRWKLVDDASDRAALYVCKYLA